MQRRVLSLLSFALLIAISAGAQKPPRALTHRDYQEWKSLRGWVTSADGRWLACQVSPPKGDSVLEVHDTKTGKTIRQPRGTRPAFTWDSKFLVFSISPSYAKLQEAKKRRQSAGAGRAGATSPRGRMGSGRGRFGRGRTGMPMGRPGGTGSSRSEGPKSSLGIMDLATGKVTAVPRLKTFSLPTRGPSTLLYQRTIKRPQPTRGNRPTRRGQEPKKPEEKPTKSATKGTGEKTSTKGKTKKPEKRKLTEGSNLILRDLASGSEKTISGVTTFGITKKKSLLYFVITTTKKDAPLKSGLYLQDLKTGKRRCIFAGAARYSSIRFDQAEERALFLCDILDGKAKRPETSLFYWDQNLSRAKVIVRAKKTKGFPQDRYLTSASMPAFSRTGQVITLSLPKRPAAAPPKVAAEDKITLDIWHYQDGYIQPMQKKRRTRDSWSAVWHLKEKKFVVLGDAVAPRVRLINPAGTLAVATTSLPYQTLTTWDGTYYDTYLVSTWDGSRQVITKKIRGNTTNSPGGKYLLWFDRDGHWHTVATATGEKVNISKNLPLSLAKEEYDRPEMVPANGLAGWTKDDRGVILYDRYDLWWVAADGSSHYCITRGYGRKHKLAFRMKRFPTLQEERYVSAAKPLFLHTVDQNTYASGYYRTNMENRQAPQKLYMVDKACSAPRKPLRSNKFFFTRSTFREYPDVWVADSRFARVKQLTRANPQQKDYRWGTAELVHWTSADGIPLKGILYKPDGFDPKRKYPMLLYFYERRSSRLHSYYPPVAGTSPNPSFYVSRGYLFFVPDIVYKDGYPGESCLKCVVPGTLSLVAKGFVDKQAIGISGHSWGGYQTAYLVTKTDIFAAAESGAPVSNMFSAYGGIRWGSGMSRQWQYERNQSRIGGTPWEYPLRYLENSPIFFADKVQTPVLMIHNDQDGAVPWYQGIEYFMALRRLGKEVYLFNYNGAGHGLRRNPEKEDWTIRMQQFFDHHLRGVPMPSWMEKGVPYQERAAENAKLRRQYGKRKSI